MGIHSVPSSIRDILFVVSGDYEPNQQLEEKFRPLRLGSGTVEASLRLVRALSKMESTTRCPDLVVSIGVSANHVENSSIVCADAIVQESDVYRITNVHKARNVLRLRESRVRDRLLKEGLGSAVITAFRADDADIGQVDRQIELVDPEGFAIAKISEVYGIPAIVVRGVVPAEKGSGAIGMLPSFHAIFFEICDLVESVYSQ